MDYNDTFLPSSYAYESPISHETPPNMSPFQSPTEWYVEIKERYYEDLREH